jgi:hypothetical protein
MTPSEGGLEVFVVLGEKLSERKIADSAPPS